MKKRRVIRELEQDYNDLFLKQAKGAG